MATFRAVHTTELRYRGEVSESVNEAWLTPPHSDRQSVREAGIRTFPEAELIRHVDAYRNTVTWFQIVDRHDRLVVESHAIVDVLPARAHEEPGWAAIEDPAHANELAEFLAPSRHVRWPAPIASFADELELDETDGVLGWLRSLERGLNETVRYAPGSTGVETAVEEVVHARRGVCQDLAHLGIAICRLRGVPARYVSGWFNDPAAEGPLESHAWLEAHLGPAGWVESDPTHPGMVHDRYVRLAVGRDYGDVPPLRGSYVGPPTAEMEVQVTIDEHREPNPTPSNVLHGSVAGSASGGEPDGPGLPDPAASSR